MAMDQSKEQGTLVAVPVGGGGTSGDDTEKSLAAILRAQYTSREFNDVYSATELREHECIIIAGMFTARFITLIMSTTEDTTLTPGSAEEKNNKARLKIQKAILSDPNAMVFAQIESWLYAFGLTRISLKRQSRIEGMQISSASLLRQLGASDGSGLNIGQKLASKMGIGSYRTVYLPKKYDAPQ